jgi:hypothetical protein
MTIGGLALGGLGLGMMGSSNNPWVKGFGAAFTGIGVGLSIAGIVKMFRA